MHGQGMPFAEIGARIGVSAERARQIVSERQIAARRQAGLAQMPIAARRGFCDR
jgi:DNA-directed RNA polymerase sigma subunit (sigma70/sigma32)